MATFPERQKQSNFQFRQYRAYGAQDIDYQSRAYLDFPFPQPGTRRPSSPAVIALLAPNHGHYESFTLECSGKYVSLTSLSGVYRGVRKGEAQHNNEYACPVRDRGNVLRVYPRPATLPAARQRLRRKLLPRRLHWSKDLGFGGNGLASLFFLSDGSPNSKRQYFVAKCNFSGDHNDHAALRQEKQTTDVNHTNTFLEILPS